MASRKVAPTLQAHLDSYAPDAAGVAGWLRDARAELRALRGVVRAARIELKFNHPCRDDWEPCSLCRALARLSRAGRAKGER